MFEGLFCTGGHFVKWRKTICAILVETGHYEENF